MSIINTSTTITQTFVDISLWPIIINGGTSSNIITITLGENIVLNNLLQYFIFDSEYIVFDGGNFTITIDGITNYPGLIQNGTSSFSGYSNTTIQNLGILTSNDSTLNNSAGWICQSYYSSGSTDNLIQNCYSTGVISGSDSGGICGLNVGSNNGNCTITNCYSTGIISGNNSGGIFGRYAGNSSGTATAIDCSSTGQISGSNSGGIFGTNAGNSSGTATATGCSSTGQISGSYSGGIFGGNASTFSGTATATNCSSTGVISGYSSGGILGGNAGNSSGTATATGCSSTGQISGSYSGGIFGIIAGNNGSAIATNCLSTGAIFSTGSGGIFGYLAGYNSSGSAIATNCLSTGVISGDDSGGIFGVEAGNKGSATATRCSSIGAISGFKSGGIFGGISGLNSGNATATNCYTRGIATGLNSYGIFGNTTGNASANNCYYNTPRTNSGVTFTNCYSYNNAWDDSTAITNLDNTTTPTYTGTTLTNPIGTVWADPNASNSNVPYIFSSFGLSPYTDPTANLYPGQTSQQADVTTGVTYSIIAIANSPPADPSVYPFITINSSTGAISVDISGIVGIYTVYVYQIFNSSGLYSVSTFDLTILEATTPIIITQPESQTVFDGSSVSFTVVALGSTPLSYQWFFDAVPILDANSSTYTIDPVTLTNEGNYIVIVSNSLGEVTSVNALLIVNSVPPTITTQPESQTVIDGSSVTFTVIASGTTPLSYQWEFNGVPIEVATSSTYTINPVTSENAGIYNVIVTNDFGSVTSDNAELIVNSPPTIIIQPQSQSANVNSYVTFSVDATGTTPLTYQWAKDSVIIDGATSSTYTIDPVLTRNAGKYTVTITNIVGSITSAEATLTVTTIGSPTITTQPVSQTVNIGSQVNFTVVATGYNPLSYQWEFNGVIIGGATDSTYTIESAQLTDIGTYYVTVSNNIGSVTSSYVQLDVSSGDFPVITTQPKSQIIEYGANTSFSVVAIGATPLTFQWYFNNVLIEGATDSIYNITNAKIQNQGEYFVIVTNPNGISQSINVVLTIINQTVILKQPQSQKIKYNCPVTFYVQTYGSPQLTYQWYFNNKPIINATTSSFIIPHAKYTDTGIYYVVITNILNIKTISNSAFLKVEQNPKCLKINCKCNNNNNQSNNQSSNQNSNQSSNPIKIPIAVLLGIILSSLIKK